MDSGYDAHLTRRARRNQFLEQALSMLESLPMHRMPEYEFVLFSLLCNLPLKLHGAMRRQSDAFLEVAVFSNLEPFITRAIAETGLFSE